MHNNHLSIGTTVAGFFLGIFCLMLLILPIGNLAEAAGFQEFGLNHRLAKYYGGILAVGTSTSVRNLNTPVMRETEIADVPADHPNAVAIRFVLENGFLSLNANGAFLPDALINRGTFVEMVTKSVFDAPYIDSCFENISDPPAASTDALFSDLTKKGSLASYVCVAMMGDIVHGYPDGAFRASQAINLAEATKVLARAYDVSLLPYRSSSVNWYERYVRYLSDRSGIPVSFHRFADTVTRADAAEMLYRIDRNIQNRPSTKFDDLVSAIGSYVIRSVSGWMF